MSISISKSKKSMLVGSLLAATFTVSGPSQAVSDNVSDNAQVQALTGADTLLTTYFSKSRIEGALEKDPTTGDLVMDENGNFKFNFDGGIYYPVTRQFDGKLESTKGPIGTVSGTALFPPEFAQLAFEVYAYVNGLGPMPAIPPVIHWTMDDITIVDAGTTYVPIISPPEEMGLDGKAFTGLGPVEIGQLDGLSMSVRMGGCFAVAAVDGVEAGKVGTYCLNSTFTFDLLGIDLGNPMQSTITGKGTSNCTTVLHTPPMM